MKDCIIVDTTLRIDFSDLKNTVILDTKPYNREDLVRKVIHNPLVSRKAIVTDNASFWRKLFYNEVIDTKEINTQENILKQVKWVLNDFGKDKKMTDNIWFVSDTHFSHRNIIQYCNRPWNSGFDADNNMIVTDEDVKRMDEDLISNWNSVVGKDDLVWHLGDFCFGQEQNTKIPELIKRLNGRINLVLGNHDHHNVKFYYDAGFNKVYDKSVVINEFVILSHAPMTWVQAPFFNISGHVHNNPMYNTFSKTGCCVCVERHDYAPVSWKKIKEEYEKITKKES